MKQRSKQFLPDSADEVLLGRLADGFSVLQDEFDQVSADLPPEVLALALEQRWRWTGDSSTLFEAARYYLRAGNYYRAFELCTRRPYENRLRQMSRQILPRIRRDHPHDQVIGKLLEDIFLVIDLATGKVERYQGLLPARECVPAILDGGGKDDG